MSGQENWKPIPGYEGLYEISNYGRVKSLARTMPHKTYGTWNIKERILKQNWAGPKDSQYLIVFLHKGKGEQHIFRVHRLVAKAFIPEVEGKTFVNHKDGDRSNNRADNLEWCTPLENTRHAFEHGFCENVGKHQRKPVVCVETGERFVCINEACEKYGVTHRAIYQVVNGECATCKGLHWQFADEYDTGTPIRKLKNNNYSPVVQIDLNTGATINEFKSVQDAQRETGIHRTGITACCRGKYHTAGGFKWRYVT